MPDQSRLDHFLIPKLIERVEINRTRLVIQVVVFTWLGPICNRFIGSE